VFAVVVVAMIAIASAALVPYLSNVISGEVTVSSPFSAVIANGLVSQESMANVATTSLSLRNIHGGEVVQTTVKFTYLGSLENVNVKEIFQISVDPTSLPTGFSGDAITCADFEFIKFNSKVTGGTLTEIPSGWCINTNSTMVTITDPSGNTYDESTHGKINTVQTEIKFNLGAIGTYNMTAQLIPTA